MPNKVKIRTSVPFYISWPIGLVALAISVLIFTFIPALNYRQFVAQTKIKRAYTTELAQVKPRHMPPPTMQQAPPPPPKAAEPKSLGKKEAMAGTPGRFSMDFGLAGPGSGGGGVGIRSGNMEGGTFEEGQTDTEAKLVRFVKPEYPEKAQSAGVSGIEIQVIITIGTDGRVVEVAILNAPPKLGFEESIRKAVLQWQYEPATVGGAPVRIKVKQPFGF